MSVLFLWVIIMKNKSKKFGSFLITGKAATLPFLANNSLAETTIEKILFNAQEPHLIQRSTQGINVLNMIDEVGVAAQIIYPGQNCKFAPPSDTMSVVVSGIRKGDHVYIASSSDRDYQPYLSLDPKFKIGNRDLRILSDFIVEGAVGSPLPLFTYGGGDLDNANFTISIPVDLNQIEQDSGGFYMQAMILRNGNLLFSELDRIESITKNCDMYGGY